MPTSCVTNPSMLSPILRHAIYTESQSLKQIQLVRPGNGFSAVTDVQLAIYIRDVTLDGGQADEQVIVDHLVCPDHGRVTPAKLGGGRRSPASRTMAVDDIICLSVSSHRDDDFSLSVSLFQITDGLGDLAERVRSVDDRCDLSSFNELFQDNEGVFGFRRNALAHPLAHEG